MARIGGGEQATIELLLAQLRRDLPAQPSPAAAARSRYSFTVERATRTLRDTAVSLSPSALSRSTSLIRRIATLGLGISPSPKRGDGSRHYLPLSSDAKAGQGAENAEIRCRIGAKSGAAFRRNHLPLSTEIRCRFAPIFAHEARASSSLA
jgi:hypothetical protein